MISKPLLLFQWKHCHWLILEQGNTEQWRHFGHLGNNAGLSFHPGAGPARGIMMVCLYVTVKQMLRQI